VNVNLSVTGGCTLGSSFVSFGDGTTANQGVGVGPSSGNATCVVTLASATNSGAVGTTNTATIQVGTGSSNPPGGGSGTPAGCPAIPSDAVPLTLTFQGADQWLLNSGQVGYAKLTDMSSLGRTAGRLITNDVTATPSSGLVREITISKCPAEINAAAGGANSLTMANGQGTCYWTMSGSGSAFINDFFQQPGTNTTNDDTWSRTYHICEAYASQGQWYVNVKWTYPSSSCVWGKCGLTGQTNFPSINP
jgi:hypothetical protein